MRRDLIFFVHSIPKQMLTWDRDYFISNVDPSIVADVKRLSESFPDLIPLLRSSKEQFQAAGFRTNTESLEDAFTDGYARLSGILDGYSFLLEDQTLEIWPLFQIREEEKPDAILKFFELKGWMRLHSKDGIAEKKWEERRMHLLKRFLKLFEVVANRGEPETELRNQIELSTKMYRHGGRAREYGIEFLCKASALEGLVCGAERYNKQNKLRTRLSSLLRHDPTTADTVDKLYELRCEASHQGKAFSHEFSQMLPAIDRLTLAALVFAIDHLKVVQTVSDLWTKADSYNLPAEVIMERPLDIPRIPLLSVFLDTSVTWKDVGLWSDQMFAEFQRLHPQP